MNKRQIKKNIQKSMLYAVEHSFSNQDKILTIFEGNRAASIKLNPEMAKMLSVELIEVKKESAVQPHTVVDEIRI